MPGQNTGYLIQLGGPATRAVDADRCTYKHNQSFSDALALWQTGTAVLAFVRRARAALRFEPARPDDAFTARQKRTTRHLSHSQSFSDALALWQTDRQLYSRSFGARARGIAL